MQHKIPGDNKTAQLNVAQITIEKRMAALAVHRKIKHWTMAAGAGEGRGIGASGVRRVEAGRD